MNIQTPTAVTPHMLRFYAKCFVYPYEEMRYELQHLFRVAERDSGDAEEMAFVEQMLNIVNMYQGMELRELREEYVALFSGASPCSLIASEFSKRYSTAYNSDTFTDLISESAIPVNPDEQFDSIINYLEFFSLLSEEFIADESNLQDLEQFIQQHILTWVPVFCEVLYKATNISFYRETAVGLNDYISWLVSK